MADPTTGEIDLGVFAAGSVDRIRFAILKDGAAWTGIDSVKLVLQDPDGTESAELDMTLETPDAGVWYYDTPTSAFTAEGPHRAGVKVTDGSIVKWYPFEVYIKVVDHPRGRT